MKVSNLLRDLDASNHDARMRRMVEVGKLAASDASVAKTLAGLAEGGFYERLLALQSCHGSRDGTARVAEEWATRIPMVMEIHPRNLGLGPTIRDGLVIAAGTAETVDLHRHDPGCDILFRFGSPRQKGPEVLPIGERIH